ncbi:uncharacterized protein LOC126919652 [Bombus affinis]|uniref:uncharacterized protein LOC126919652 n=1 Tax=Bombus affinis TaxID=309941 RepID=UPI0021B818B6|nr:uncharacterized protein LOC126919652 [Bombus affinis]
MTYLVLTIGSQWTFGPHFKLLVPKVTMTTNALCGLLPNIDGAEVGVRRLYEGVIRSRVLYGAPVWTEDLMESRCSLLLLRRFHRMTAIRIVRGYRTISYASATVLAASPPFELQALAFRRVYHQLQGLCSGGDTPSAGQSIHDVRERPGNGGAVSSPPRIRCGLIGPLERFYRTGRPKEIVAGSH